MESTGEGERLKVAVLGATGQLGSRVVARLRERGVDVVEVSRGQGVDAYSGAGLDTAFAGVSTVVDCLHLATLSRRRAVDYFTTTARNVLAAAQRAGVPRIVCVTILNAREPEVHRWMGYYAGKAAQERTYRAGPVPVTVVASAQWYELAETLLSQLRIGPFSVVPGMRSRPLAAEEAAAFVADRALEPGGTAALRDAVIAGPEVRDMAELARAVARRRGGRRKVVRVPVSVTALGNGGLLPRGDFTTAPTRFEDWLRTTS
ncbi:SDR family oxidoreductase [Kocuria turfanensis]|uniref:3-beta hydroxysteroid dehydrogenase n=1 Tax=Kocuria turfanensis TaxID=388357 RepID=A0A512II76_9MICC|nr:NAD(P)H-binding protein [Kocuria turfanensis]GEO97367.1 3-beta hydroxysteroid dehydrogenase [Kocuria turfanensis]